MHDLIVTLLERCLRIVVQYFLRQLLTSGIDVDYLTVAHIEHVFQILLLSAAADFLGTLDLAIWAALLSLIQLICAEVESLNFDVGIITIGLL